MKLSLSWRSRRPLRHLLQRRASGYPHRATGTPKAGSYRPSVEALEDRWLPSSFAGSYTGDYGGQDAFGNAVPVDHVVFTVDDNGTINVTAPGSGRGTVTSSGSATIGGAGGIGSYGYVNYAFTGNFVVSVSGIFCASGSWSANYGGAPVAQGTWSATDRAGVFCVTNRNTSGAGSLWQAIADANAHPGSDTIIFAIASGLQIIPLNGFQVGSHVQDRLPDVTDPVTIDGTSQPGYAGKPLIVLDGGASNAFWGLQITAPGSVVRGLTIIRCRGNGVGRAIDVGSTASQTTIVDNLIGTDANDASGLGNSNGLSIRSNNNLIQGNVISGNIDGVGLRLAGSGNVVRGNLIGTNAVGTASLANGTGMIVTGNNNTIGGAAARNVISGNAPLGPGVSINGNGNVVQGNFIGTDITGTVALGNAGGGIALGANGNAANNNTIAGNLISANTAGGNGFVRFPDNGNGIAINGSKNIIQGNHIGTDVTGTKALPNSDRGAYVTGSGNTIGGNVIAFSGKQGVDVASGTGNAILGNFIFGNGSLGIDLGDDGVTANDAKGHAGPNNYQNFPVLTSAASTATSVTVSGTLSSMAKSPFRIEFFANPTADSTGYGQGKQFLGFTSVTADASGKASFSATLPTMVPLSQFISATATDADNNTSEFSSSLQVSLSGTSFTAIRNVPFTGLVAAFTNANGATISNFTVMVAWGDGSTSSGAITQPGGAGTLFQVTGSHTYTKAGSFPVAVTIHDIARNTDSVANSQALVRVAYKTIVAGDGQAFALDDEGQLWRNRSGVWTPSGGFGVEIVVTNTGDSDPNNDVVCLRGSDSKIWTWNQTFWNFAGGYLPSLTAGDNQVFGIGFDGQIWRYRLSGAGAGWTRAGGWGVQIAIGSVGDANPDNDILFLRSSDSRVWTWNQSAWQFTGGWLPNLVAGDNQVFGLGFDGKLWRYRVSGPGAGWTASGGYGAEIAVGNLGDGDSTNDIVFLRSTDNRLWTWNQSSWNFTGGWLGSIVAGDGQVFGRGLDGQAWRFRVNGGWASHGAAGTRLEVAGKGDGMPLNDILFQLAADGSVSLWDQST